MDRFFVKSFILFLLLASLSGTTFLSPKQDVSLGPEKVAGALGPKPGPTGFEQSVSESSGLQQYTAGGHVLGFRKAGVVIASGSHAVKVEFVNARSVSPVEEGKPSESVKSHKTAQPLGRVTYPNLWDGVTLIYEKSESGVVESTYQIQPGRAKASNPVDQIRLRYNVPVKVDENGDLVLSLATGEMKETRPVAWQEVSGTKVAVEAGFRLMGEHEAGFKVGAYDPQYPLIIDPVLSWNTFLGENGNDRGYGIALDTDGNSYVTGYSATTWGSPLRPYSYGNDVFVAKLNANGTLLWNTFLGDWGDDQGYGIAIDTNGNSYVTGYSATTWGSPLRPISGFLDVFVAKLDTNGTLLWNTFLGGGEIDAGYGIAIDTNGESYVTGITATTWGSPLSPYSGSYDVFVAKLDTNGTLLWNTFLGGGGYDQGYGIDLDTNGDSYVTGITATTWGSPLLPYSGGTDVFVAKLDTNGTLLWNTFLGGGGDEYGYGIAINTNGSSYVAGNSTETWGSPLLPYSGSNDVFVARLDANGTLLWNTFLGGELVDMVHGIALDTNGNSYVTGYSATTWGSPLLPYSGSNDAFVAKISNPARVDFNGDGQEDILWRYYGSGGYNRAWFLGNSEQAGLPLLAGVSPQMGVEATAPFSGNKARGKAIGNDRARSLLTNRPNKSQLKGGQDVMGSINRRGAGVGAVDDPRKAGGVYPGASLMRVADPRYVNLAVTPMTSTDHPAAIASAPTWLGGADLLPVGDVYWWIVGMADFNNDSHVDILWRNMSSGSNVVWYMNGTEWTGSAELLTVGDLYWEIVGTGDFNNDTHPDILWRNAANGTNVVWYMDGTTWIGSAVLLGVSDPAWEIAGTGDFNNDGHVDILWRYNQYGGYNVVWYMNDAAWIGSADLISVADLSWEIAYTGDYNNDGKIDILWRYMWTGSTYIWYMDGVTWIGGGDLLQVSDTTWKLVPGCRIW